MRMIEPCCFNKQLNEVIDICSATHGTMHFFSYSDWDASALLEYLAGYAQGGLLGVVMIRIDIPFLESLRRVLARMRISASKKSVPYVSRVILITQPGLQGTAINQRNEIRAQLGEYIANGRLVVCEDNVGFRCFTAHGMSHSLVVQGSINLQQSNAMQMFTLTASPEEYAEVELMLKVKARTKNIFNNTLKS